MSTKTNRDLCRVLSLYPKAISHLRWQVSQKRFGPVLGAGVSVDFGVPGWSQLVTAIAADDQVRGKTLLNGRVSRNSYPYKTEMLFQRFRSRHPVGRSSLTALEKQNTILADWLKLCQSHLYGKTKPRFESEIAKHPYLPALIPLVQESYVTVNFNFDDILERALSAKRREKDVGNRGFEAVTDPWPQFRRTDAVIYHPHGYVPFGLMENAVDRFVFSEASYSKQYVGARGHDTSFLLAHFARHTCLLIGCSLEDELRSVLMRGAEINPGNYHYYVHYVREGASLAQTQRDLIADKLQGIQPCDAIPDVERD
ncbi:MAG: SIR2 family protein [Piscinibacter sp.]